MNTGIRIDKWLWAVRVFKTRSLSTDYCKRGRIFIGDQAVKASRLVQEGDIVVVKKMPVTYTYKVVGIIGKRVSASIAKEQYQDLTPIEELEKLKLSKEPGFLFRSRGSGRPTKKERRDLDKLMD